MVINLLDCVWYKGHSFFIAFFRIKCLQINIRNAIIKVHRLKGQKTLETQGKSGWDKNFPRKEKKPQKR